MKPNLVGQGGQLVLEAVLLMVVLFGITLAVSTYFKKQEILKQLISGPWQSLAGMLQNGSWGPSDGTAMVHPNAHERHMTVVPSGSP